MDPIILFPAPSATAPWRSSPGCHSVLVHYPLCSVEMKLPEIAPADPQNDHGSASAALLLAAEAWTSATRPHQLDLVLRSLHHSPPRFLLVAASDQESLQGVVLAECLPGKSAVVMTPQLIPDRAADDSLARDLLAHLEQSLQAGQTLLAQALTAKRNDVAARRFLAAGFEFASDLLYLVADCPAPLLAEPHQDEDDALPFQIVAHPPQDVARWGELLERTYIDTLDCPAVEGLRPMADVLAGYRDIGRARGDWWFIARHDGQDVGCLLLAEHGSSDPASVDPTSFDHAQAELIYMGIAPEARGQGWGYHLAREAQRIAQSSGCRQLILSVDADNAPALRHYLAAGFRIWEQRVIWIKSLAVS